jgi:virginiamycin B lyase
VWTLNQGNGSVTRVDTSTNKVVKTIDVGMNVASGEIAAGEGSVWISAAGVPLVRIDPRTNKVAQRFSGEGGGAVFVAHGSVWIAAGPNTTWRLDPKLVAGMRP